MSNFFNIRAEIAEKLTGISAFKQIYTPLNSVKVTEMSQVTPSAHVNFARITPKDSSGSGQLNLLTQQWSVTVACRNSQSQMQNGNAVTDEAGVLLEQVIQHLGGWKPPSARKPLLLQSVQEAFSPTCAYLTAVFESERFI